MYGLLLKHYFDKGERDGHRFSQTHVWLMLVEDPEEYLQSWKDPIKAQLEDMIAEKKTVIGMVHIPDLQDYVIRTEARYGGIHREVKEQINRYDNGEPEYEILMQSISFSNFGLEKLLSSLGGEAFTGGKVVFEYPSSGTHALTERDSKLPAAAD